MNRDLTPISAYFAEIIMNKTKVDDSMDGGGTSSGIGEGRTTQEQLSRVTHGAKTDAPGLHAPANLVRPARHDMLIEMISPRIKEIEEKFSRGEGLEQDDINTLLLKSQYNHINHLDEKLNEVTADVASLKGDFQLLRIEVTSKLDTFEKNIELKISQAINTNMRWSIGMIAIIVTVLKLADMFVK